MLPRLDKPPSTTQVFDWLRSCKTTQEYYNMLLTYRRTSTVTMYGFINASDEALQQAGVEWGTLAICLDAALTAVNRYSMLGAFEMKR